VAELEGTAASPRAFLDRLALRIDHGVLRDGTRVEIDAPEVIARVPGHALVGGLELRAAVDAGRLSFTVDARDLAGGTLARAPSVHVAGDSRALDLAYPMGDLHGTLDVPRTEVPSLARLAEALGPGSIRVKAGTGAIEAHGEASLDDNRASGNARLELRHADVEAGELRFEGSGSAAARVGAVDWEAEGASGVDISAQTDGASVTWRGLRVAGTMAIQAGAAGIDVEERRIVGGRSRLEGTAIEATRGGSKAATIARVTATATADALALADPLRRLRISASVERAGVRDAKALAGLLPEGVELEAREDGSFDASATVEKDGRLAEGSARFHVVGLGVATPKAHATADIDASGAARLDMAAKRVLVRDLDVAITRLLGGTGPAERVDVEGGRIAITARTNGPYDYEHPQLGGLEARLQIADVDLRDARALNRVLPAGNMLAIESGTAHVSAGIEMKATESWGTGRAVIDLAGARVRLHDAHIEGNVVVDARLARIDRETSRAEIQGSHVTMRGVDVWTDGSTRARGWHGDLVVQRGTLLVSDAPALDADVFLTARDARPALALLLSGVPSVVVPWIDMKSLSAGMHLHVEPRMLLVGDFVAGSENVDLRGTYAARDERVGGAFVVERKPFSIGLRVADDGMHLRLFGLHDWYEAQRSAAYGLATGQGGIQPTTTTSGTVPLK
jgi:hypothetical protein